MKTENEVLEEFIGYIVHKFGKETINALNIPDKVRIGERVIYRLTNNQIATRKDFSKDEEYFNKTIKEIADQVGGTVHTDPVVESGLPYPRVVDIIEWSDVAMDIPAKKYVTSGDILPKPDFSIEWLFGVVLGYSSSQLVYIDFTHPKVKAAFSVEFDIEDDLSPGKNMMELLQNFRKKQAEAISNADRTENISWIKLVQINDEILTQTI